MKNVFNSERRFLPLITGLIFTNTLCGCSFIFTRAPQPEVSDSKPCTKSKAWPLTDAISGGVLGGIGALATYQGAVSKVRQNQGTYTGTIPPEATIGIGAGLMAAGATFIVSSVVGFKRRKQCLGDAISIEQSENGTSYSEGQYLARKNGEAVVGRIKYLYDRFSDSVLVTFYKPLAAKLVREPPETARGSWEEFHVDIRWNSATPDACTLLLEARTRFGDTFEEPQPVKVLVDGEVLIIPAGKLDSRRNGNTVDRFVETLAYPVGVSTCRKLLEAGAFEWQLMGFEFKTQGNFERFAPRFLKELP